MNIKRSPKLLTRAEAKGEDEALASLITRAEAKGEDEALASLITRAEAKGEDEALASSTINFGGKTKIKVIGVGGAGSNAVSRMMKCKLKGVDLIAVNTDVQDLKKAKAHQKLCIGKSLTGGLGAGMNPEIGKRAAEKSREEILELLKGSDIVFVTAGLGGGTGSGAAPAIAEMAKNMGALTIAVVTKPFSFEGKQRVRIAEKSLENLRERVDALLMIPNDRILAQVDEKTTLLSAFWNCDEILRQAVQGITDLILLPGIINVDFADVKAIMENSGPALFGVGQSQGEKRVEEVVNRAINSPLLDFSIEGAKGILFNISGGEGLSLNEISEIAKMITKSTHPKAKIIFGAIHDKKFQKDEIKLTVIATGFEQR